MISDSDECEHCSLHTHPGGFPNVQELARIGRPRSTNIQRVSSPHYNQKSKAVSWLPKAANLFIKQSASKKPEADAISLHFASVNGLAMTVQKVQIPINREFDSELTQNSQQNVEGVRKV